MNRIVHFEIPSDNPEVASEFYNKAFGWNMKQWGEEAYWMATTGPDEKPGINGAIMKKRDPAQPVVNTIEVDSIDKSIFKIESYGGLIVVPKMAIPGVGWLAYFKDPDQNIFGVMQSDSAAK